MRLPKGFSFSVAQAAIKRPGRSDMALIFSEAPASVAAAFTTNRIKAAPLKLCIPRARRGRGRALVVNSGNANACTGPQGMRDAQETSGTLAALLGIDDRDVFVGSTGVIGVPMPMDRVREGLKALARGLGGATLEDVARAIMTTDTFPKFLQRSVRVGRKTGTLAGVCKGAGMIAPNMATMLCYIITDVAIEPPALRSALREAVGGSFNLLTVDGDRSTNDTALVMANGMLGNAPITAGSRDHGAFKGALSGLTYDMSRLIASDGEGATKLVEVEVRSARTPAQARRGALAVANSLLVKTAIYGRDPNWGRIISSLGASGIAIAEEKTDIYLAGIKLVGRGTPTGREAEAAKALEAKEIKIRADLRMGEATARVLTCDLTEEYIRINAEYTT